LVVSPPAELRAVHQIAALPVGTTARVPRPIVPLSASDLLVNARGEPGVGHALQQEIPSADSIDVLCAFVRWNGLRLLESALQAHCDRGRPLRVLTTTYIGATERRALDRLERADGQSVLEWFDGRIAVELRLRDALERGLLCPFHYRNFRFDQRFRAITGGTRASLTRDVEEGFPRLPAGCVIRLDRVASEMRPAWTEPASRARPVASPSGRCYRRRPGTELAPHQRGRSGER
jgi:hypothetical protein